MPVAYLGMIASSLILVATEPPRIHRLHNACMEYRTRHKHDTRFNRIGAYQSKSNDSPNKDSKHDWTQDLNVMLKTW